jgi:hypothetical protein
MSMGGSIGGHMEYQWFQCLKRTLSHIGGTTDDIKNVFRDPDKLALLATYILTLVGKKPIVTPADQAEQPAAPSP